jgi:hypothetical protein
MDGGKFRVLGKEQSFKNKNTPIGSDFRVIFRNGCSLPAI